MLASATGTIALAFAGDKSGWSRDLFAAQVGLATAQLGLLAMFAAFAQQRQRTLFGFAGLMTACAWSMLLHQVLLDFPAWFLLLMSCGAIVYGATLLLRLVGVRRPDDIPQADSSDEHLAHYAAAPRSLAEAASSREARRWQFSLAHVLWLITLLAVALSAARAISTGEVEFANVSGVVRIVLALMPFPLLSLGLALLWLSALRQPLAYYVITLVVLLLAIASLGVAFAAFRGNAWILLAYGFLCAFVSGYLLVARQCGVRLAGKSANY